MYEYELYKLVDSYDPILKQKLIPFDFEKPPVDPKYFAISMLETMMHRHGIGLAANQVGFNYRVFVMGSEGVGFALFNPEIIETSGEDNFEEGCLSFPGLFLPIKRPATVTIRYQDMNKVTKEQVFSGLTGRTALHEYDHIEGIVYTSKVSPLTLDRAKSKVKRNIKLLNAQVELHEKQKLIRKATENVILAEKKKLEPDQSLTFNANNLIIKTN